MSKRIAMMVVGGALLLRAGGNATSILAYVLLALLGVAGPTQAVLAMAGSFLVTMINEGLVGPADAGAAGRYLVICAAAAGTAIRRARSGAPHRDGNALLATTALGLAIILHSLFVSPFPDVSVLKALMWSVSIGTLLSLWAELGDQGRVNAERSLVQGALLVAALSVPLVFVGPGYLRNGVGFQGLLNHPQALGAALAPVAGWIIAGYLEASSTRWPQLVAAGALLGLILLSRSRSAGLAVVAGVTAAVALVAVVGSNSSRGTGFGRVGRRVAVPIAVALLAAAALGVEWSGALEGYLKKGADDASIVGAYDVSRGHFIRRMWRNVESTPWLGIGFGIASEREAMVVTRDDATGLPVGAPVEKGVMPLAIIEELGVVGGALVFAWMAFLVRRSVQGGMRHASVVLTVIAVNLGEAAFFSTGGLGIWLLILFSWGVVNSGMPGQGNGQNARRGVTWG